MLGNADATPMIAVKDLDRARKFYQETLGLSQVDDFGEGFLFKSGSTKVSVYRDSCNESCSYYGPSADSNLTN